MQVCRCRTLLCLGILAAVLISMLLFAGNALTFSAPKAPEKTDAAAVPPNSYAQYLSFFEEVYKTMDENYYLPVRRQDYNRFVKKFKNDIYGQLKKHNKKDNYITWRSAAYLVDYLKDPGDTFSAFFPPKAADTFEHDVLGQRIDLGIEGTLGADGYRVDFVEPRCDAHAKGLREGNVIVRIDTQDVLQLTDDDIRVLLAPEVDTRVALAYLDVGAQKEKIIEVVSKEYFKQTVFPVTIDVPSVFCLEIRSFNRKTSEDLFRFLSVIEKQGSSGLVLDVRGNPGGPPLAAAEISAFFLPPGQELTYFQKKGHPKSMLRVPEIPQQYWYRGPVAILVDEGSGSAAELFSGILQRRERATLFGTNTAGKVFLKSMFDFDDDSMLLLVTARGYFYDGTVFDFAGLKPDYRVESDAVDVRRFAAEYLAATGAIGNN